MKEIVGFIGIGAMGWPMASQLVSSGLTPLVYDSVPGLADRFAAEVGGNAASSLRQLGKECQVVITMLPTSTIVRSVLLGPKGAGASMAPDSVVIDMSSGVPAETIDIGVQLSKLGVRMLDAPVSGGVRRAVTGELAIIVGGSQETLHRVEPILAKMGRSITHVGDTGSGQALKALNNLAQAGSFLIALEAALVGKKFGLDPALMIDVFNASSGMNYNTQTKFKQFLLSKTYAAGFLLDHLVKDVQIALDLAKDLDAEVPFSARCSELWSSALKQLGPGHDHTEIAKVSGAIAGAQF